MDTHEDEETVHFLLPAFNHFIVKLFHCLRRMLPHLSFLFFTELFLQFLPQFLCIETRVNEDSNVNGSRNHLPPELGDANSAESRYL